MIIRGYTQELAMNLAAIQSRLRSREVSTRKQVGDTEVMVNEEGQVWGKPEL